MEFLGTQYRQRQVIPGHRLFWPGFHASYLDNGLLTYRDASIEAGYPRKRFRRCTEKKDLIFFPAMWAIYLGEDRYPFHGLYENALCDHKQSSEKEDPDCRQDLVDKITECGSVL